MIKAIRLRSGNIILIDGKLFRVHSVEHRTPGKGASCIQTKLRNLSTGNMIDKRFNPDERVEKATLDSSAMEYLYSDETGFVFMNMETYEQISLDAELIGDGREYLLPNTSVQVDFYDGTPVGVEFPRTVVLKVVDTEPSIKKATASALVKPAILETGLKVTVPGFVSTGELIKVNTETGEYVSRANSYDDV